MPNLVLFDLDHTLLAGDSDASWGEYLVSQKIVNQADYTEKNKEFLRQYQSGTLDIHEYAAFAYKPLVDNSIEQLESCRADFIDKIIKPLIQRNALKLVRRHQEDGDLCVIITATNSFVTKPIAELFNIEHLIATEPAMANGKFLGSIEGTPCFQAGKLEKLQQWMAQHNYTRSSFDTVYSYSDSYNDLPLLEYADQAIAVNPDDRLRAHATTKSWQILQLML